MKAKFIFITLMMLIHGISCHAQASQTFTEMLKVFPEMNFPSKYKTGIIRNDIKDINKVNAITYLHYSEEDLKINDFLYDFDEDIKYDNWVDVLPGALGKISKASYVTLIYALLKAPTIGTETYIVKLSTFSYNSQIIDSIIVRSQHTKEEDWRDVVFLEKNVLRIFDYKPNLENFNVKGGAYYIIDEKKPQTIVETNDYQIDENGKINLIKTHPKQYLKNFVSYYRSYHENSDDPMNEY